MAACHRIRAERQDVGLAAVGQFVTDADIDVFNTVHDVQFGDAHTRNAIDLDRAFQRSRIKPAATARTAGYRTEFIAALGQSRAHFVKQFGRKRSGTDAGSIGFDDTQHIIQHLRRNARSGRRGPRQAVGRGYERISPVVDVQQRALRAFKQQLLAFAVFLGQHA